VCGPIGLSCLIKGTKAAEGLVYSSCDIARAEREAYRPIEIALEREYCICANFESLCRNR